MDIKCAYCGLIKPITDFYKDDIRENSKYKPKCKKCVQIENNKSRDKTILRNTDERIQTIESSNLIKTCAECKVSKPITQFNVRRSSADGHETYCRECADNDKNLKYHNHKSLPKLEYKQWRNKENKIRKSEKVRLKTEVFTHYCSDGIIRCLNPYHIHPEEITDLDILTLDHINGDGYKDKDKNGRRTGGMVFYRKLKLSGYPTGFQVLCGNCQMKKKILNNEHGGRYIKREGDF
jgi:hypothetical protein